MIRTNIPRLPWPSDFPTVFVHRDLKARNSHPAYADAKAGGAEQAKRLVEDLLDGGEIERIARFLDGRRPILMPVTADEEHGFNAIPDAMAEALARRLDLSIDAGGIVQSSKVGHTKADGWHRLVTPAEFAGAVVKGADYLLVDDHVGFGGTLANLRGFIAANGGGVVAMTTLTETRDARQIAIRDGTRLMLWEKHGRDLDHFWRSQFGHGIDCLTDIEAGYLCRVESVAAIKDRMAEAAARARGRGFSAFDPESRGGDHPA